MWDLVPTLAMQNISNVAQFEVNLMGFYQKRYWAGVSFRADEHIRGESLVGMAGLYITDFIRIGYAYDLNLGNLSSNSSGSHELMLGVRLKPNTRGSNKTPRLFLEY